MVAGLLLTTNVSRAESPAGERTTAILRANGSTGSIEQVRSAELPAEVQAGTIARTALRAELDLVEPHAAEIVQRDGHHLGAPVDAHDPEILAAVRGSAQAPA